MAIKKEVHRRAVNREGPWKKAKKTLNKATDFVKRQLCDLLQIFHNSNAGTKVVVSSVVAGIILIMLTPLPFQHQLQRLLQYRFLLITSDILIIQMLELFTIIPLQI